MGVGEYWSHTTDFILIKSGLILPRERILQRSLCKKIKLPFIYQKVFPRDSLISVTGVIVILLFKFHTTKETQPHFPRMTNCLIKMLVKDFFSLSCFSSFCPSPLFLLSLVFEIFIECIQSLNFNECIWAHTALHPKPTV